MDIKRPLLISQPQIGNLIRELRLDTGLTQEQFAAHLGVTCSSVNRWENGRSQPLQIAMQKVEEMLLSKGMRGRELIKKYFPKQDI